MLGRYGQNDWVNRLLQDIRKMRAATSEEGYRRYKHFALRKVFAIRTMIREGHEPHPRLPYAISQLQQVIKESESSKAYEQHDDSQPIG